MVGGRLGRQTENKLQEDGTDKVIIGFSFRVFGLAYDAWGLICLSKQGVYPIQRTL
ncbi:MAG: hypothetical protein HKUEN02_22380 [Anaerolineaceae bacterium]|nr:MAG: hypothetical protein HKUEN02_22380 [Anaerolineaceae bacterium]